MSARESIEALWDRATPVAPLLDAYSAEVLREAAAKQRRHRDEVDPWCSRDFLIDLIDPDKTP